MKFSSLVMWSLPNGNSFDWNADKNRIAKNVTNHPATPALDSIIAACGNTALIRKRVAGKSSAIGIKGAEASQEYQALCDWKKERVTSTTPAHHAALSPVARILGCPNTPPTAKEMFWLPECM